VSGFFAVRVAQNYIKNYQITDMEALGKVIGIK